MDLYSGLHSLTDSILKFQMNLGSQKEAMWMSL
jgi:hypothetical protein